MIHHSVVRIGVRLTYLLTYKQGSNIPVDNFINIYLNKPLVLILLKLDPPRAQVHITTVQYLLAFGERYEAADHIVLYCST